MTEHHWQAAALDASGVTVCIRGDATAAAYAATSTKKAPETPYTPSGTPSLGVYAVGGRRYVMPGRPVPLQRYLTEDAAAWVEATLSTLTLEQAIAQCVAVGTSGRFVPDDDDVLETWCSLARDHGVGTFAVYGGTPRDVAFLTNRLQRESRVPALCAADFEAGAGQQMDGATEFPANMAFAAAGSEDLMYRAAAASAREGRAVGIHLTFSPVVDLTCSPDNPAESVRSFGGDLALLGRMVRAYVRGSHDHGMLTTAKHFPGRGDVRPMPELARWTWNTKAAAVVEREEFRAFAHAVEAGVDFVMTEHVAVPAVADGSLLPATVERRLVHGALIEHLGFMGVVTTDDLWYDHVVQRFGAEEVAVRAFEAGHDVILKPKDAVRTIAAMADAVRAGRIPESRVAQAAGKLLRLKARLGLHTSRFVDEANVGGSVGTTAHRAIVREAAERSLTLLRNDGVLPLPAKWFEDGARLVNLNVQKVVDDPGPAELVRRLSVALPGIQSVTLRPEMDSARMEAAEGMAGEADLIIVSLFVPRTRLGEAAPLEATHAACLRRIIAANPRTVLAMSYGNPYLVTQIPEVPAYVVGYGERGWFGNQSAYFDAFIALLRGALEPAGRLPVHVSAAFPLGSHDEARVPPAQR